MVLCERRSPCGSVAHKWNVMQFTAKPQAAKPQAAKPQARETASPRNRKRTVSERLWGDKMAKPRGAEPRGLLVELHAVSGGLSRFAAAKQEQAGQAEDAEQERGGGRDDVVALMVAVGLGLSLRL